MNFDIEINPDIHQWVTLYKCRWCGNTFQTITDFQYHLYEPDGELADMRGILHGKPLEHDCGEGRVGLGDPIGFRQLKDYEVQDKTP